MTETGTRTEERVLASDLWSVPKSRGPMTLEEEFEAWRATTRVLDSLCGMADRLMLDPLILALADALGRAREERRAEDRLTRPEGAHLGPHEAERLMGLMRRSDALNTAFFALKDAEHAYPDVKAEYLEVIREAQEASEQFARYRAEVGLPDHPTPAGRTPASQPSPTRAHTTGPGTLRGVRPLRFPRRLRLCCFLGWGRANGKGQAHGPVGWEWRQERQGRGGDGQG
jgi:hypothetical protein